MSLYEITDDILRIMDAQENAQEGEEIDIKTMFDELKLAFDVKVENIIGFIRNLKAEAEMLKVEKNHFATRQKVAENKVDWLKNYLKENMIALDVDKIKAGKFKATLSNPIPRIKIINEDEIPATFINSTMVKRPDKKRLLEYFKETGEIIAGTDIAETRSLILK